MMRPTAAVCALGLAGLACSASYEVGQMDPAASGGSGAVGAGPAMAGNDTGSAGAGKTVQVGPPCIMIDPTRPPPEGELATPDVVWRRISPFVWGGEHAPPQALPAKTTYPWAGDIVHQAFAQALAEVNGVPGASYFIRRWLDLDDTATFQGDYDSQLARSSPPVLQVLLQSSWAPGHAGVFSEKPWLQLHEGIPHRGSSMLEAVFSRFLPAAPPGVDQSILDSGMPDREAMEIAVSSQACAACHAMINPLGYSLGHFDREGNYRTLDHDQPIDASGSIMVDGRELAFVDIADFGAQAANSCEAMRAIVDHLLRVALQDVMGYDAASAESLVEAHRHVVQEQFVLEGYSYTDLVRAYARSPIVLKP
jgi:hypothetical protein